MRRTYRSKKDTGSGIDHRDMVLSVDSKSSVFDAFYIQNIKQVKRELSCVSSSNPYTAASNRVRKRKYVKRLKESEPLKESLSESAYLTPDKSIHVNKAPDLFDQLLNSSTTVESSNSTNHKASDLFSQMLNCSRAESPKSVGKYYVQKSKTTTKTYCRKKPAKLKKTRYFNCIGDSDDDKENTISDESNISHNTSNIKAYKLVIEKEKISSPIHLDDSITKMVEQLPVLSKLNQNNSQESLNSCRFSTIQFDVTRSPQISNSPQCSTPFHEKHRGKSIYRFSPIQNNFANSFEMITTIDESKKNETALHADKDVVISEKLDSLKTDKTGMSKEDLIAVNDEGVVDINDDREVTRSSELQKNQCANYSKILPSSFSTKNVHLLSNETSSLQITDYEPFLGFSGHNSAQNESDLVILKNYEKIIDENCSNRNNISDLAQQQNIEPYISLEAEENYDSNISIGSKNENSICYDLSGNTTSVESEDIESVSSYNTCDSDNLSEMSSTEVDAPNKEAIVVMEKMSDSLFHKYYEKMADYSTQDSSSGNSDKEEICNSSSIYESEYASFEEVADNNSSNSDSANVYKDNKTLSKQDFEFIQCNISSSENDNSDLNDENVEEEEEKCVSFVTTRRKVRKTNDSLLLNLDNSYFSNSSGSLDKTVLSNNEERLEKSNIIENKTLVNDYTESNKIQNENITEKGTAMELTSIEPENEEYIEPELDFFDEQITNVNSRKSSRLFRESYNESRSSQVMADGGTNFKPGIVLKPGKKWERSLSIYRRMTTMGDNFNHSILDEESIKNKGRKYRQSVISTMEMQECQGSLHNESVISRRSTFVSKPNRSTIKIVRDPNASTINLSSSVLFDDLQGFLNEDCDDTIVELSKLSIGDSGHEITVLEKFHDTSNRIVSARDYVLRRCNQTDSILFDECYPDTVLKNCRKIGEGVYGEVYLFRAGDGRARVMKIVPIAGTTKVNGEDQKDFHEIISEIVIAMELSALRAPIPEIEQHSDEGKGIEALDLHAVQNATDVFNEVLAVRCVHGSYPSRLLDLWELYDETKGSENDSPAELPADQQYLVLELANAGQDLESYQFNNAEQACALFKQIALGLAVAEEALQFEHRDLHWGNVLIAPTDQKYATFVIRGRLHRTARCGVAATLIDYSLSRASRGGKALYNDLADDDALFDAVGDYQFEVYRLMRDKLGNDWKNFEPYTNILWLHYTVDKMITALRYTRTNTKIHKHYIAKLKEIKNRILDYGSATQFVLTDNEF